MSSTVETSPTPLQRVAVIVGLLAYLASGFLYLTSGLVVPGGALVVLWLVWLTGMWFVAKLLARWSWWVLLSAPAAVLFWVVYLSLGETLFGWTP